MLLPCGSAHTRSGGHSTMPKRPCGWKPHDNSNKHSKKRRGRENPARTNRTTRQTPSRKLRLRLGNERRPALDRLPQRQKGRGRGGRGVHAYRPVRRQGIPEPGRHRHRGGAVSQLLERVRPLVNMNIPTEVLLMGLDRTTKYTEDRKRTR